jgi:hypothetical protein
MNVRHTIVWSEEHVRPGKLVFDTTRRKGSRELVEGVCIVRSGIEQSVAAGDGNDEPEGVRRWVSGTGAWWSASET